MGLLDQVMGLFGGNTEGGTSAGPAALMDLLANHEGGLDGLLQKFHAAGMTEVVQSWVGTGQNLPISADSVHQALGSETMQQLAAKTGLPLDQISAVVAQYLPQIVDGLTPNGTVEAGGSGLLSAGAALLKNRFGIA